MTKLLLDIDNLNKVRGKILRNNVNHYIQTYSIQGLNISLWMAWGWNNKNINKDYCWNERTQIISDKFLRFFPPYHHSTIAAYSSSDECDSFNHAAHHHLLCLSVGSSISHSALCRFSCDISVKVLEQWVEAGIAQSVQRLAAGWTTEGSEFGSR
jgi:hypothetical protein